MKALFLFMGFFVSSHADLRNDLSKQKLKGRVKTVIRCQFPVVDNWIDTAWSTIYVFKYDENGNQVEDADYTGGSLASGFRHLNHRHIYTYDARGNQTTVMEYSADSIVTQRVEYKYDEEGRRTERCNYTPDGKLWRRSVFKYNSRGQEVGCMKYTGDSTLLQEFTYKYDRAGNMAEELLYVHRITDSSVYNPTDSSRVARLDYIKTFVYDDSGKKVKEMNNMYGSSFPFITEFRYSRYDSAGNWLRQEYYEGKGLTCIVERAIEYY